MVPQGTGQVQAKSQTESQEDGGFLEKAGEFFGNVASFFGLGNDDEQTRAAGEETDAAADNPTYTDWEKYLIDANDNLSSENVGRIWTDKTVSKDSQISLPASGEGNTFDIVKGDSDFLVLLSALSSTSNLRTVSDKPLDIVLTLDVSGSMADDLTGAYSEVYNINTNGDTTYYALDEETNRYVEIERVTSGWLIQRFDHWELNGETVEPKTSASDSTAGHIQFYIGQSKLSALKTAVNNFIDATDAENRKITDPAKKHNIAIVKYADDSYHNNNMDSIGNDHLSGGRRYNYTQIVSQLTNDATDLQSKVNALDAAGATSADYGLNLAERVITNHGGRENAQKVVILFTDGEPNHSSGFDGTVANAAVAKAKTLKDSGVLVYSVGVFDGADPTDTTGNFNAYMHGVSSNYPAAESYTSLGEKAENSNYYKAASSADDLNKIFQEIADDIQSAATGSPTEIVGENPAQSGYITFTDRLGNYMKVDSFKSIVYADHRFDLQSDGKTTSGNTDTYVFEGQAAGNNLYESGDMSNIIITVERSDDLSAGDLVTVKIPAQLIPLRNFNINTENGVTTMEVDEAFPIRIFYGVSLKDGVAADLVNSDGTKTPAALSIPDQTMQAYIDANKQNGKVSFYSNDYTKGSEAGKTIADFEPAETNNFYYFTQDTPVYDENDNPAKEIQDGAAYYYKNTFYVKKDDGTITQETSRTDLKGEDSLTLLKDLVQKDADGNLYIPAKSPRLTRINDFTKDAKDRNVTGTAAYVIDPVWSKSEAGAAEYNRIDVQLGNNGKLDVELPGTLTVTKTAQVASGFTGPADLDSVEFDFTITLTDTDNNNSLKDKYSARIYKGAQPVGDVFDLTFQNGSANKKLKNGETLYIYGISAGDSYTVKESDQMPAGFKEKEKSNDTGVIAAGETAAASFTNEYTARSVRVADGAFKARKEFDGWDNNPGIEFEFRLTALLTDGQPAPLPAGETTIPGEGGTQYISKTVTNGNAISFGELVFKKEGTYNYLVYEVTPAQEVLGVSYSNAVHRVTVEVTDDGAGQLSADYKMYKTFDDGGTQIGNPTEITDPVAVITNAYALESTLVGPLGNKAYTDNGTNPLTLGQFKFNVEAVTPGAPELKDRQGNTVTETSNAGDGSIAFGQAEFTQDHVRHTYVYKLSEVMPAEANEGNNYTVNGMTYDPIVYYAHIAVTAEQRPDGEEAVKAVVTYKKSEDVSADPISDTDGNPVSRITFANEYNPKPAVLTSDDDTAVQGKKTLTGRNWKGDTFNFKLTPSETDTAYTENGTAVSTAQALKKDTVVFGEDNAKAEAEASANDAAPTFDFGKMTFTKTGTYTFHVKEIIPGTRLGGMAYDTHTAVVTVTVTDDKQGHLHAAVAYNNTQALTDSDRAETNTAAFTNIYTSSMNYSDAGALQVVKRLTGRSLQENEFSFTIQGADGTGVTAQQAEAKLTEADKSFANPHAHVDGYPEVMTKLESLTFTQDDAGKVYAYIVDEEEPQDDDDAAAAGTQSKGVTYDTKQYRVEIEVFDDADGTMHTVTTVKNGTKVTGTYDSSQNQIAQVEFHNSYVADPVELNTEVSAQFAKILTGRDWKQNESYTFTLKSDVDGSPLPKTTDEVSVDGDTASVKIDVSDQTDNKAVFGFGIIEFTDADMAGAEVNPDGTEKKQFTYTVKENAPDQNGDGITYDRHEAKLVITVTDDQEGNLTASAQILNNAEFTNAYHANTDYADQVNFSITKVLNGRAMEQGDFTFRIKADDQASADKINVSFPNGETFGNIAGNAGQVVEMVPSAALPLKFSEEDAGKTYTYIFSEEIPADAVNADGIKYEDADDAQKKAGRFKMEGCTYDSQVYTVAITVADNGDGTLSTTTVVTDKDNKQTTYNGNTAVKPKISIAFENSYQAEGTLEGSERLSVTKTVKGPWTLEAEQFSFKIEAENAATQAAVDAGKVILPDLITISNTADDDSDNVAVFAFGDLKFKSTGNDTETYRFKVTEVIPQSNDDKIQGMTYDSSEKIVIVTVTDDGKGSLTANLAQGSNALDFTNTYTTKDTAPVVPTITKMVTGHASADGQFSFKLEAADENTKKAIEEGDVKADQLKNAAYAETKRTTGVIAKNRTQEITFGSLVFTKTGTYNFNVTETGQAPAGWTYDNHTYKITVEVTDENSQLTAKVTEEGTNLFTNSYGATTTYGAQGGLNVTKTLLDRPLEAGQFAFTIEGADDASKAKLTAAEDKAFTNTAPGPDGTAVMAKLASLSFDEEDIDKTFRYTISETDGKAEGYTYDKETASVSITVKDGGAGKLYTETTVIKGGNTNTYSSQNGANPAVAAFENSYAASTGADGDAELLAGKILTGRPMTAGEFKFEVYTNPSEASGKNPVKVTGGTNEAAADGKEGNVEFEQTFAYDITSLKQAVTDGYAQKGTDASGNPMWTLSYKAIETTADLPVSVTAGNSSYEFTIQVVDNGDGTLTASVQYPNGANKLVFTNTYDKGTVTLSGDTALSVEKTFTGRKWRAEDKFSFALSPVSVDGKTDQDAVSKMPMPAEAAEEIGKPADGNTGSTAFGSMTFTKAGTYVYEISEDNGGKTIDGITYDGHKTTVTIEVAETNADGSYDGKLHAAVTYDNKAVSADKDQAVFENTYSSTMPDAEIAKTNVKFQKVITGRDWLDGEKFNFTLTAQDKAPLPENGNTKASAVKPADGNTAEFSFGTITYTYDDIKDAEIADDGTRTKVFTYKVKEEKGGQTESGLTFDSHEATLTVTVKDDGKGNLTATPKITDGTFTNVYTSSLDYNTAGGLVLKKTLNGHDMAADLFSFEVTAEDKAAADKLGMKELTEVVKAPAADDGREAVINLLNGKQVVFTEADADKTYTYTVSEVNEKKPGYTYDTKVRTVTIKVTDDGKGGITLTTTVSGGPEGTKEFKASQDQKVTAEVPFTNSYYAKGTLGGEGSVGIKATKTLEGRNLAAGEFKFAVKDVNGKTVSEGSNAAAGIGAAADITFDAVSYDTDSLKQAVTDKTATKETVEGKDVYTFQYTAVETGDMPAGVTAAAASFQFAVKVTDNGNGTLSFEVVYPDQGIAFKNIYSTGDTPIVKTVSGSKILKAEAGLTPPDIADKFTFKLTAVTENAPMPEKIETKNDAQGNVNFGEIKFTLDMLDGIQTAEDGSRSKEFTYRIEESGSMPGIKNDSEAKTFTLTLKDDGKGNLTVSSDPKEEPLFVCENTYRIITPAESSITDQITIEKNFTGRDLAAGEFNFVLKEGDETVATGTNDADGNVIFSAVKYTKPGTHTYTVYELKGEDGKGITYDTGIYAIQTEVTDQQDGTLAVKHTTDADKIVFNNTYAAAPTSVTIGLSKILEGAELKEGQFNFLLKDKEGNVIAQASNDADGQVIFEPIEYQETGVFEYSIAEENDNQENITYDDSEYHVTVTITDDGEGYLKASVEGDTPVFTNIYTEPEKPVTPEEPEKPEEPEQTTTVKTGDEANVAGFTAAAIIALGAAVVTIALRRRRTK